MNRLIAPATLAGCCLLLFACATPEQAQPSGLVVSDVTVISPVRPHRGERCNLFEDGP